MVKIWLCGIHACTAALQNPERVCYRLLCVEKLRAQFAPLIKNIEVVTGQYISDTLKSDVRHQGVILQAGVLRSGKLSDFLNRSRSLILVLDQITDPRNVGAIMRTAAAFGADCIVHPNRHSATENSALARVASGALDMLPTIEVINVAHTLEEMKRSGYWIYGLDCNGTGDLRNEKFSDKTVLVLGSEGNGMRPLVR